MVMRSARKIHAPVNPIFAVRAAWDGAGRSALCDGCGAVPFSLSASSLRHRHHFIRREEQLILFCDKGPESNTLWVLTTWVHFAKRSIGRNPTRQKHSFHPHGNKLPGQRDEHASTFNLIDLFQVETVEFQVMNTEASDWTELCENQCFKAVYRVQFGLCVEKRMLALQ